MQEIKYYCDKCGVEAKEADFRSLRIGIASSPGDRYCHFESKKHLCNECLKKMGLEWPTSDAEYKEKEKTFEDKFFELLEEYGVQRT